MKRPKPTYTFFLLIVITIIIFNNFLPVNYIDNARYQTPIITTTATPIRDGYLIYTNGCHIPDFGPYEASIARYFDPVKPIVCEHGTIPPLVESNNSAVFVNLEAKLHYYNESENAECCWRPFWRKDNKDNEVR